jgi:F-type H+-transporting ATPase subunit gamma
MKLAAAFPALSNNPMLSDTFPLSKIAINDFAGAKYDKVIIMYTDFISPLRQKVSVRRLLPLSRMALDEMVDTIGNIKKEEELTEKQQTKDYVFEPSESEVLEPMLYRLCEMQIYQAVLESTASEHSARMIAMRNASDNATDIIDGLTLVYNQARQTAITAEIAEISSAMAVLGK